MIIKVQLLKYNVIDKQGDIYKKGSVKIDKNNFYPIANNWDISKPPLGRAIKFEETDEGLYAMVELNLEIRPGLIKESKNEYNLFELSLIPKEKDVY